MNGNSDAVTTSPAMNGYHPIPQDGRRQRRQQAADTPRDPTARTPDVEGAGYEATGGHTLDASDPRDVTDDAPAQALPTGPGHTPPQTSDAQGTTVGIAGQTTTPGTGHPPQGTGDRGDQTPGTTDTPQQRPIGNSPSRRGGTGPVRTRGAGASRPRLYAGPQISVLTREPTSTPITGGIAIGQAHRHRQLCTWPHATTSITPPDPSDVPGVGDRRDPVGTPSKTETRNAALWGAGYTSLSVSDLWATLNGGSADPPQIFSAREGGWVA